ncbi:uncharacterized protein BO96DRAFT_342430 [Aspergillus niger CBS 101883]|uniref:Contig An08c0230, genomic contig n=2 Tax=Aspergillus niger TaxID=5061 RepID=A5ABA4_ASPNC|nr:uncharacterized protein BO96DRAFT_342430 [Aspergillus niger CBS 101883]XP_059606224.1 uncharacterized protein An08g09600 [Aspergillus niger]PYH54724.1 hypothetical protein BO96DRAFT_342430 [Aspergillus niger CBS 101883]CAK96738.1 unnamed protein product [Aspergillus niger]
MHYKRYNMRYTTTKHRARQFPVRQSQNLLGRQEEEAEQAVFLYVEDRLRQKSPYSSLRITSDRPMTTYVKNCLIRPSKALQIISMKLTRYKMAHIRAAPELFTRLACLSKFVRLSLTENIVIF